MIRQLPLLILLCVCLLALGACGTGSDYPAQQDELDDRFGGEPAFCDVNDCTDEPELEIDEPADADASSDLEDGGYDCNEYVGCVDTLGSEDYERERQRIDVLNDDLLYDECYQSSSTAAEFERCMEGVGP